MQINSLILVKCFDYLHNLFFAWLVAYVIKQVKRLKYQTSCQAVCETTCVFRALLKGCLHQPQAVFFLIMIIIRRISFKIRILL